MLHLNFGQAVGHKFNSDGSVRNFPGNTIICLLDHSTDVFRRVKEQKDFLACSPAGGCITVLPDESLHMTAIEGVCDKVRERPYWTDRFPLDAPLSEIDDFLEEQWKKIPPLGVVRMRFDQLWMDSGICIGLYPDHYEDDKRIRDWRDFVSNITGLRFPGHDRYRFHISLAYGIRMPDEKEDAFLETLKKKFDRMCKEAVFTFEVPEPSLTFFDGMFFFNKNRIPRKK